MAWIAYIIFRKNFQKKFQQCAKRFHYAHLNTMHYFMFYIYTVHAPNILVSKGDIQMVPSPIDI